MEETGHRDEMFVATKYCGAWKTQTEPHLIQSNFGGGASKNLHLCVEASLKKLRTSYIDLVTSKKLPLRVVEDLINATVLRPYV